MSTSLIVLVIAYAWNRYSTKPETGDPQGFGKVLANKWYVDEIYEAIIVKPINWLGKIFNDVFERSIIDWIVNGVGKSVQYGSRQLRLLQSGQVGSYVLFMIIGMVILFVLQFFIKKQ